MKTITFMIIVTIVFIFFDILTGGYIAWSQGKWKSSTMRQGIKNKGVSIIAIFTGLLIDYGLPYLKIDLPFRTTYLICMYIVVMEIGSIAENISIVYPALAKIINRAKESIDNGKDNKNN